ncbi:MAG TPA: hypothetical protein VG709_04510, partial [Actinomycetota bacterium]|nr:hypothetical protein [Actinomycetota bacterium]
PKEVLEFDAIGRIDDTEPADPTGAKGNGTVVTAVNVHYAVWTPAGTPLAGPDRIEDLFAGMVPSRTIVFDPKVVYDPKQGRFYLVIVAYTDSTPPDSHILIASFSDDEASTPLLWCKRRLPGDAVPGDGNLFADYPGVGFDDRRLYVATNQFNQRDRFRYAQVLAINRADLGSGCTGNVRFRKFWDLREPSGRRAFTVQPAVSIGSAAARAGTGISFDWRCFPCRGRKVTIWRWAARDGALRQRAKSLDVGVARVAPLGRQRGGGGLDARWDTGDLRLVTSFFDTDRQRLYGGHSVLRNLGRSSSPNESVARWYELYAPGRLKLAGVRRKGIVGTPNKDSAWPAIAANGNGRVFLSYSRAAPDEFLSAWGAVIQPKGTGRELIRLRRGEARHEAQAATPGSSGVERWGDYNAITRDPVAPLRMWSINQYAKDDRDRSNGVRSELWQQVVNALRA